MRSAVFWMMVLVMSLAACGGSITGEGAVGAPPSSEASAERVHGTADGDESRTTVASDGVAMSTLDDHPIEQADDPPSEPPTSDVPEERVEDREGEEPEPEDAPVVDSSIGEVPPELMGRVLEDLSSRIGAPVSALTVVRAESVVWNDGSLGCGRPGETYTMAVVNGYWIEIAHGSDVHDYRTSERGFVYCESGGIGPIDPNG